MLNGEDQQDSTPAPSEERVGGSKVRRSIVHADNARTAQNVSAVYACVRILSDAVASLPLKLQKWDSKADYYKDCEENIWKREYYCLTVRPNEYLTAYQFFKNIVTQMLLRGNAYVLPYGDGDDLKYYLLSPNTSFDAKANTYTVTEEIYSFLNGTYEADEILHFKNVSLDGGLTGVSTIHFAATQLNILSTAASETLDSFAKGGIGRYIYHDNEKSANFTAMTDKQMATVVKDMQEQMNDRSDIIIQRGQGQLESMSMDAQQLQFLSKEEFTIREVARYFGVPLQKLFEKGDQTYKSTDAANIALYSEGLRPILTNIEQEFKAKRIPWQFASNFRYLFDTKPLYISDKNTEADYYNKRLGNGSMTPEEIRADMNMPKIKGTDVVLVSANLKTADQLKQEGTITNNKPQDNGTEQ